MRPHKLMPLTSTDHMDHAVRGFLMLLTGGGPLTYERARDHCSSYHGEAILQSWPVYAMKGTGHIPKAAQSDLIWRMMAAASPPVETLEKRLKAEWQADLLKGLLLNHSEFRHPEAGAIVELMDGLEKTLRRQAEEGDT